MILPEEKQSSEEIYCGKVIRVTRDSVRLPDGGTAAREVVRHPGAVAVLAVNENDEVILVEQYRYPCGTALLEIPAGKLDHGSEPPHICALRELAEETPFTAQSVELLYTFFTSAGFCDEKLFLYRAHGVRRDSTLQPEAGEFVECRLFSRSQVRRLLADGAIHDAKTLIALQHWLAEKSLQAA